MSVTLVSTRGHLVPYLTEQELKWSAIYNQLKQLVPGSSDAARDAELGRIIIRASAVINGYANQNLAASLDTEIGRVRVSLEGDLRLHTRSSPIIEVVSVEVGPDPASLVPIDLSTVAMVVDPWRISIPWTSTTGVSGLNLPALVSFRPGATMWAKWVYVNGYPVTTIAEPTLVGDTSIAVVNSTGILAGYTQLTIEDGKGLEQVTPSAVTGNVLTVPPLMFAHSAGTGITDLPNDIKAAALELISRLRDRWSLNMNAISMDGSGSKHPGGGPRVALCDPAVMLQQYRRPW